MASPFSFRSECLQVSAWQVFAYFIRDPAGGIKKFIHVRPGINPHLFEHINDIFCGSVAC